ncbi:MAG: DUF2934 domain-containing protein [Lentisphaerae bacterium]|nr:DUF2934 domain-containing protein [Lentisphaerota bacterium]
MSAKKIAKTAKTATKKTTIASRKPVTPKARPSAARKTAVKPPSPAASVVAPMPAAVAAQVPAKPAPAQPAPVSTSAAAAALAVTPAQSVPPVIKPAITPEQRFEMIQREAYLIAEKNGFRGDANGYWIAAEKHITDLLRK